MKKKQRHKSKKDIKKTTKNKTPTLSVCMIVKNEEENLPRALGSIQGLADEIIVVDTGSTDRTVEIARSFGAKVYFFEWCDDFSAARNESLKYATCDYILWLDADDEIEKKEHKKLKDALKEKPGNAWYMRIRINDSEGSKEALQLRVFPNKKGIIFEGRIHEQVYNIIKKLNIPMANCNAKVIHHGYYSDEETRKKLERNIKILEQELKSDPDNIFTSFFMHRTLQGLKELERAEQLMDNIIQRAENDSGLRELDIFSITLSDKANILQLKGCIDDAVQLLEYWNKKIKSSRLVQLKLGELYFEIKEYEKVYKMLMTFKNYNFEEEILPFEPNKAKRELLKRLGVSSIFIKDYNTARACFNDLIEDESDGKENYYYLILCEEQARDMDKALSICEDAIKRFENDVSFLKKSFFLFLEKGDLGKAEVRFSLIDDRDYDLELTAGGFYLNCMKLNLDGINQFYRLIFKNLFLPERPFPEDYPIIKETLKRLGEHKALSFFEKGINYLLGLESDIESAGVCVSAGE